MQDGAHQQVLPPGLHLARHRHVGAYAALVLVGGYEEAGDAGRRRVRAGDVVFHGAFEAHLDRAGPAGAKVLNLPLGPDCLIGGFRRAGDLDAVARLAERDAPAAADLLLAGLRDAGDGPGDWPDRLAEALIEDRVVRLDVWARVHGLSPEAVSRGFRRVFGVSPRRFRLEARARRAWAAARVAGRGLAEIAADLGFADQAHMTRAVAGLTGRPPGEWRRQAA
jgi:AraC-like DNA-binding protein